MNSKTFASSLLIAWPVLLAFASLQTFRVSRWLLRRRIDIHHAEDGHVVTLEPLSTPLRFWYTVLTNSAMALFLWALVVFFALRWLQMVF